MPPGKSASFADAFLWGVWHVRQALWVQIGHQGFRGSTKGVERMLDAVLFKQPQHAIDICFATHIDGIGGQFIHGSEIAGQPMSVGEVEPIAPGLEKSLTRF
jgi:hypothetical protein